MSLARWHDPALIDHLARVRAPWTALTRSIVQAALTRFLPNPPAPLIEVGAGGGQLREWLPPHLLADIVHTEPSEPFVRALRERHPDANVVQADASALPFESGSVAAVLALCVFDTLPNLATVRDELHRVLRPGGKVLHVIDLATSPDCLFPGLIAGGELPLTNFARDRALLDVLTDAQKALLPPADEFDEVLAVPWESFRSLVGTLEAMRHPIAAALGPYGGLLALGALDPERLALRFMAASADPAQLLALNRSLLQLTLAAKQLGRTWPLRAVSTRGHIRARLNATFAAGGFEVEFAGPVAARAVVPREGDTRFTLRHAGRTISRAELPTTEFGLPVEALLRSDDLGLTAPPRAAGDTQAIRETTVEACSFRRT